MKKTRRILAMIGALLLAGLYISTLVFALTDHSKTMGLFKTSVAFTILIPVLLYAYTLVYRVVRKDKPEKRDVSETDILEDEP